MVLQRRPAVGARKASLAVRHGQLGTATWQQVQPAGKDNRGCAPLGRHARSDARPTQAESCYIARGAARGRYCPSTYGRNARRTSDAPTKLGSLVYAYQAGSPVKKWACRSTSAPYRSPSSASAAFSRRWLARATAESTPRKLRASSPKVG